MNYLLRNIPENLWIAAKHQAVDEGLTLRELILKLLEEYLRPHLVSTEPAREVGDDQEYPEFIFKGESFQITYKQNVEFEKKFPNLAFPDIYSVLDKKMKPGAVLGIGQIQGILEAWADKVPG